MSTFKKFNFYGVDIPVGVPEEEIQKAVEEYLATHPVGGFDYTKMSIRGSGSGASRTYELVYDGNVIGSWTVVTPERLPNPTALTFTGAVSATYDGSMPVSVEIPSGGGGDFDASKLSVTSQDVPQQGLHKNSFQYDGVQWGETSSKIPPTTAQINALIDAKIAGIGGMRLLKTIQLEEEANTVEITTDENGNTFNYTEFFLEAVIEVPSEYQSATYIQPFAQANGAWNITINGAHQNTQTTLKRYYALRLSTELLTPMVRYFFAQYDTGSMQALSYDTVLNPITRDLSNYKSPVTGIKLQAGFNTTTYGFGVGSIFKLWGK